MVLYLVYNIKKNIHNLSSFAACCGTQRIWPSVVTRRTAIITTHGRRQWMPRRPSGSACRPGRNGRHYAISARLGTTSARAVGSGGNHDSDHKGSLFLPIAGLSSSKGLGYRTKMISMSTSGYYWSSSPYYGNNNYAGNLYFTSGYVFPQDKSIRTFSFSVRCVQNK